MFDKAKQIGLPRSYVELRHEIVHEGLPSIDRMRTAVQSALRWLREDYWLKLLDKTIFEQNPLLHALVNLKGIFRTILKKHKAEALRASNKKSDGKAVLPKWSDDACLELVRLCKNEKAMITELAVVFLECGLLVPQGRTWVILTFRYMW